MDEKGRGNIVKGVLKGKRDKGIKSEEFQARKLLTYNKVCFFQKSRKVMLK